MRKVECARLRIELGNPPGKNGSLGDAISWEALLREVPRGKELFFITDDRDYVSALDENEFNAFLRDEWAQPKKGRIVFYKRLSSFFKDKFPDIRFASELEKELLIGDLAKSPNFAQTHNIVSKLSKFTEFTAAQRNEIVEAAISNNQVAWIVGDADVHAFLKSVIAGHERDIKEDSIEKLQRLITTRAEPEPVDEIPF